MIEEADARAMVRLLGETAALEGGHTEKKRFLMDGLCGLVGADTWIWTLSCQLVPGGQQTYAGFIHGGFDEARFTQYLQAVEHPDMGKVAQHFFEELVKTRSAVTMQRGDIDPEGIAYDSVAGGLWAQADIGPLILSGHPLDANSASGIGIYRRLNDPPFTTREVQIVHIVLTEVPWLHLSGWPEDRGATVPSLYPKQRIVLNLLLDGMSRKQIAAHLNLSEHTVSGYAKDIYRHFGVHSHPELMKRFLGTAAN